MPANAQLLGTRALTIGSSVPSVTTTYNFHFTYSSTSSVGSVTLTFCDNSPVFAYVCNAPPGLDATGAALNSQTGNVGYSIDTADTTANFLVMSRASSPTLAIDSSYNFSNIVNPSAPNYAEYVRIATYASTDGSGPETDTGAVAFSTNSPLEVNTFVPPYIRFCVGVTVAINCSTTNGDSIDLGELSSTHANTATAQFATGTNSQTGYAVFAEGTTMTSGNSVISSLSTPQQNHPGTPQFGFNLKANLNPLVGAEKDGTGTVSAAANYNIANSFTFNSGDLIASSPLPSEFDRMTSSFLVNVPKTQDPGVYSTTITYLAVAQF